MAWPHIQLFYHMTKDSRVGTASLYNNKGYLTFRVLTGSVGGLRLPKVLKNMI
jgi:hypothetical protein